MATFLFDKIIFGPVVSRRLGNSLGINLLPLNRKICTFNCVYCECGWSDKESKVEFHDADDVINCMNEYFSKIIHSKGKKIDAITFAGNGEPTIHPEFSKIICETIKLRDKYLPDVKTTVLTNATTLKNKEVVVALKLIDEPILKIDTVVQSDFDLLNRPFAKIKVESIINDIYENFDSPIIQTMFLKGKIDGQDFDNTREESLSQYYDVLKKLRPRVVMIYSIARETPLDGLQKISEDVLNKIADDIRTLGFQVLVTP